MNGHTLYMHSIQNIFKDVQTEGKGEVNSA